MRRKSMAHFNFSGSTPSLRNNHKTLLNMGALCFVLLLQSYSLYAIFGAFTLFLIFSLLFKS